MKLRNFLNLILAGLSIGLPLSATRAAAQAPTRLPNTSGGLVLADQGPRKFDFSFPGGTVAEFAAQLKKAIEAQWKDEMPNLIFSSAAASIPVPKLELRSVDLESLMNAMNFLQTERKYVWRRLGGGTWVVEMIADPRKTQVFYVGHLLAKFKIDDINTALTTVWELSGDSKPELKYHKDTQLLIIRADKAQLESALMVLAQLREALPNTAFPMPGQPAH